MSGAWSAYQLDGGTVRPVPLAAWLGSTFDGGSPTTQFVGSASDGVALLASVFGHTVVGRLSFPGLEVSSLVNLPQMQVDGSVLGDEHGTLYLHADGPVDAGVLRSYSPSGQLLWEVADAGRPLAVFDGTLVSSDGTTRDTRTGEILYHWSPVEQSLVLLDARRAIIETSGEHQTRIQILDRVTGAKSLDTTLPERFEKAFPTEDGGLLVITEEWLPAAYAYFGGGSHELVAWNVSDGGGSLLIAYEIAESSETDVQLSARGLVVEEMDNQHSAPGANMTPTRFMGFAIPGEWELAEHGWFQANGNLGTYSPR